MQKGSCRLASQTWLSSARERPHARLVTQFAVMTSTECLIRVIEDAWRHGETCALDVGRAVRKVGKIHAVLADDAVETKAPWPIGEDRNNKKSRVPLEPGRSGGRGRGGLDARTGKSQAQQRGCAAHQPPILLYSSLAESTGTIHSFACMFLLGPASSHRRAEAPTLKEDSEAKSLYASGQ